jgi:hypothetical protein
MLEKLDQALTPARRTRLYQIAVAVGVILVARGFITANEIGDYLVVLALLLGVAAPAVAKRNVDR